MIIKMTVRWLKIAMCLLPLSVAAADFKASSWIGRVVVTGDGELLGRVEDFALDLDSQRINYVVVSIGSFLIDDNLIAVDPQALSNADDGDFLVLHSDGLDGADRFGPNNWPDGPDVVVSDAQRPTNVPAPEGEGEEGETGFSSQGLATISDGRRTATLKSGERNMTLQTNPAQVEAPAAAADQTNYPAAGDPVNDPLPGFDRLDLNDDGRLSRREIGPRLGLSESLSDFDQDGSGSLDEFEYGLLLESRET